jgi:hypothetical protein
MKIAHAILTLLLTCGIVRADLVMSLTPALQYDGPGMEVVFSGTLTNSSTTDKLFLNDIAITVSGPAAANLTPGPGNFFANVPGILLPNESYTSGEVFRATLAAGAPLGDYSGSVGILGGADITATTNLASCSFTVSETPMENWRVQVFGSDAGLPQAADTSDYDGDGIPNILEYALNLDPTVPDSAALPPPVISGGYLTLSYVPNALATDLTFAVESSSDLVNWGTADVLDITPANPNPPGQRTFRYNHPLGQAPQVFLRLKVTR